MNYTKHCHRCSKATDHNNTGCVTCGKNKKAIADALNYANFEQLSYGKLIEIVKIIKRK